MTALGATWVLLVAASIVGCAVPPKATPPNSPPAIATRQALGTALWSQTGTANGMRTAAPSTPVIPTGVGIAYADGTGLWVVEGAGEARRLVRAADARSPLISPDGSTVVYERDDGLWAVAWDGTEARRIVDVSRLPTTQTEDGPVPRLPVALSWLPDSSRLIFSSRARCMQPCGPLPDDLWMADVAAGTVSLVLPRGEGGPSVPSPDGSHVAVSRPGTGEGEHHTLALLDLGSGMIEPALYYPPISHDGGTWLSAPFWSRDGDAVLVALPAPEPGAPTLSFDAPVWEVWQAPVGGDPRPIDEMPRGAVSPPRGAAGLVAPHIAPDVSRWAYAQGEGSIVVVPLLGGDAQPRASTREPRFLAWAPDSRHFLFSGDGALHVADGEKGGAPPVELGEWPVEQLGAGAGLAFVSPTLVVGEWDADRGRTLVLMAPGGARRELGADTRGFDVSP